ncbi:MAG: hypothetical protein WCP17_01805 [bacterium]
MNRKIFRLVVLVLMVVGIVVFSLGCSTRMSRIETPGVLSDTTTTTTTTPLGTTTTTTSRVLTASMAEFLLKEAKTRQELAAVYNCIQYGCSGGVYVGGNNYGGFQPLPRGVAYGGNGVSGGGNVAYGGNRR